MIRRYCIIAVPVFDINTIRPLAEIVMHEFALALVLAALSVASVTASLRT
jgi:hypothetical protein